MDFTEIFAEYFSQFRAQGSSIPAFGAREYTTGIYLGNAAIRRWDRVDGVLWRELIVTASEQPTGNWATQYRSIEAGTTEYPAPDNMRKPPAFVRFRNGSSSYFDVPTIPPQDAFNYDDLSSYIWFEGGANTGYTMHVGGQLASQYDGWTIDYVFIKKPTMLTVATTPAAIIVDMSDPGFMIQEMLRRRFRSARNGMGYKTAEADAKEALLNMKIENDSGVWGNADRMRELLDNRNQGWGVNSPNMDIRL
jgi:hypothetical protein